jgi:hypothetical protein
MNFKLKICQSVRSDLYIKVDIEITHKKLGSKIIASKWMQEEPDKNRE